MSKLSTRASNFPQNPIRGMEPLVKKASNEGITVIPLNIGAPDTNSPIETKEAISQFILNTHSIRYGPTVGNYNLIKELTKFYRETVKFENIVEDSIAITQGASEALELVLYSIADTNNTIATFDPCYPNYLAIAYKYGINVIPIKTSISNSFHFDSKKLSEQIPKSVKAIIWSSPGNPTGTVFNKEELNALLEISRERDIWLIADEVYRSLVFDESENAGEEFKRSLSILDMANNDDRKRIIVVDSMSKLLGLCGARIGTILANPKIIQHIVSQASVRGSASTISQAGIEAINNIPLEYYSTYRQTFKERRDFLYNELIKLKNLGITVSPNPPEGAFYLIVDLGVNAYKFVRWLITDYPKVSGSKETIFLTPMVTPNGGFYITKGTGTNEVRIAYVINTDLLKKSIAILADALTIYKKK